MRFSQQTVTHFFRNRFVPQHHTNVTDSRHKCGDANFAFLAETGFSRTKGCTFFQKRYGMRSVSQHHTYVTDSCNNMCVSEFLIPSMNRMLYNKRSYFGLLTKWCRCAVCSSMVKRCSLVGHHCLPPNKTVHRQFLDAYSMQYVQAEKIHILLLASRCLHNLLVESIKHISLYVRDVEDTEACTYVSVLRKLRSYSLVWVQTRRIQRIAPRINVYNSENISSQKLVLFQSMILFPISSYVSHRSYDDVTSQTVRRLTSISKSSM